MRCFTPFVSTSYPVFKRGYSGLFGYNNNNGNDNRNKTLDLIQAAVSFKSWKGHAMHETKQVTVKSAIQKCEWIYKDQNKP